MFIAPAVVAARSVCASLLSTRVALAGFVPRNVLVRAFIHPAGDTSLCMEPPPGYRVLDSVVLTRGRSIGLQALSLLLGVATLAVLVLVAGVRSITIGPVILLVVLAGTFGVVLIHEGVHWLAYTLSGLRPRFGAGLVHGMPVLSTTVAGPYGRDAALASLLAPLVLIDGLLLGASALVPGLLAWLIVPIAVNTAGSAGDLWLAARLVRYDPFVLVADRPDGLAVYGRLEETGLVEP
jgi:hypothetical protein